MIVVPVTLVSAIDGRTEVLSTLLIDNVGGTKSKGDYRVRMFGKQQDSRIPNFSKVKPIREARVEGHARLAEPVGNLVGKAMQALNYTPASN